MTVCLQKDAKKIYKKLVYLTPACMDQKYRASRVRCGLCGGTSTSFHLYSNELQLAEKKPGLDHLDSIKEKVRIIVLVGCLFVDKPILNHGDMLVVIHFINIRC